VTVPLAEARPPADEEQVAAAERQLEVAIPDQYRRFLTGEANGGRPQQNVLPDDDSGAGVEEYLGVGLSGDSDLVAVYSEYRDRVPAHLLPVAHAPGGNLICLSLQDGSVWFWDHEGEADPGQPAREDNVTQVADGFDAFASRLAPPDQDGPEPRVREVVLDPAAEEFLRQHRGR
jgi:hypothetical protein